jgi:hypothetical protein
MEMSQRIPFIQLMDTNKNALGKKERKWILSDLCHSSILRAQHNGWHAAAAK